MSRTPTTRRIGAVNGDREIIKECFDAVLRFMELEQRLRAIHRAGLVETK